MLLGWLRVTWRKPWSTWRKQKCQGGHPDGGGREEKAQGSGHSRGDISVRSENQPTNHTHQESPGNSEFVKLIKKKKSLAERRIVENFRGGHPVITELDSLMEMG